MGAAGSTEAREDPGATSATGTVPVATEVKLVAWAAAAKSTPEGAAAARWPSRAAGARTGAGVGAAEAPDDGVPRALSCASEGADGGAGAAADGRASEGDGNGVARVVGSDEGTGAGRTAEGWLLVAKAAPVCCDPRRCCPRERGLPRRGVTEAGSPKARRRWPLLRRGAVAEGLHRRLCWLLGEPAHPSLRRDRAESVVLGHPRAHPRGGQAAEKDVQGTRRRLRSASRRRVEKVAGGLQQQRGVGLLLELWPRLRGRRRGGIGRLLVPSCRGAVGPAAWPAEAMRLLERATESWLGVAIA